MFSLIAQFLSSARDLFRIADLRTKLLVTALLITVYRIGSYIPIPGINTEAVKKLFETLATGQPGMARLFMLINMFAGGAVARCTIFALGIMPYISASIILQLLTTVYQPLKKLAQEGEAGRRKITQYTRYSTVGLSIFQSIFITRWLATGTTGVVSDTILPDTFWHHFIAVLALTTGTTFLMWLGEQITERGIGNGISLIIMAGIVADMPSAIYRGSQDFVFEMVPEAGEGIGIGAVIGMIVLYAGIVAAIVIITQGHRRITVQQAKQTRGRKVWGGQRTYMPIRVNHAGVIPIIFASSLLSFPAMFLGFVRGAAAGGSFFSRMIDYLHYALVRTEFVYLALYVVLIIFFCYFWTSITFQPIEVADRMKEYGSFLPGTRPGRRTAEALEKTMERITLAGSSFLAMIAIVPMILSTATGMDQYTAHFYGGTTLLIVVGVALDIVQKLETQMMMRHYEGFMKGKGRIRGRGPRPR
jgi:preprotein translocase subunit SecY